MACGFLSCLRGHGDGVCGCVPSARIVVFVSDALASWPCLMCLCVGEEFAWVHGGRSVHSLPFRWLNAARTEERTQCRQPFAACHQRASVVCALLFWFFHYIKCSLGLIVCATHPCWSRLFHTQMCASSQLMSTLTFLHARPPPSAPKGGRAVQVHGDHHAEREGDVRSLPQMSPSALRVVACAPFVAHARVLTHSRQLIAAFGPRRRGSQGRPGRLAGWLLLGLLGSSLVR